jgi:RNA polymerase sigma factor (sigma-70 family)
VTDLDGVSDGELVRRLPEDPVALEELFRRHRRMVVAYGARRCAQPADVADLLGSTFLAVLESAQRYDPAKGEVRPWLIGIAHRQLGLARRREARARVAGTQSGPELGVSDEALSRLEEQIDAARATAAVGRAFAGISGGHREVLWLVGYDQLSHHEAAQVLGITSGALRVRLVRARRALRTALGDTQASPIPMSTQEVQC